MKSFVNCKVRDSERQVRELKLTFKVLKFMKVTWQGRKKVCLRF